MSQDDPSQDGEGRGHSQHPGRRLLRKFVSADSYGLVLVLVVLTYLASVSFTAGWAQSLVLVMQIGTLWLALRTARSRFTIRGLLAVVLSVATAVALANLFVDVASPYGAVAVAFSALMYFAAPIAVLRDISTRSSIGQETVLGAIAAYLFVGMFFAFTYRSVGMLQPTPFFGAAGTGDMSQVLFFSFVTLTTTGYGDLVPVNDLGQTLAVAEAVIGQLFLVTAVAKIITAWRPRRWERPAQQQ